MIIGAFDTLPLQSVGKALVMADLVEETNLRILDKATVPIIKMVDKHSGTKVDIGFNMTNGLRTAELIKHYKKAFPALSKLIYVLKQFLHQRDLNEVFYGGLSSYVLILLTVSFFQLHPRPRAGDSDANLGVLLLEFLELYGHNFNFMTNAIRVVDGGSICPKKEVGNVMGPHLCSDCRHYISAARPDEQWISTRSH